MKRLRLTIAASLLCALVAPRPAAAATPEEIDAAIEKGKQFLYSKEAGGENWEGRYSDINPDHAPYRNGQGGETALALYALITCGEKRTDPRIEKAINYLFSVDSPGIYSVGIRCQLWLALPMGDQSPARKAMLRDREILLKSIKSVGPALGHFGYTTPPDGHYDHSISQFGLLGVWACEDADLEVPVAFWRLADKGWRDHQLPDGAWNYSVTSGDSATPPSLQMTAAGVASLFLAGDYLNSDAGPRGKAIERGIKWIEQNFNRTRPGDQPMGQTVAYALWGVMRVGLASGYKYIGDIDWYERGCDQLIREQQPDGSWQGVFGGDGFNTSLAMLFLERGRSPLAFNKLQYDVQEKGKPVVGKWNKYSRDIANITRWISKNNEKEMRWQVMPLDKPVSEWHEAPVMYISGDQELAFTPDQEAKIKQFVEEGGLVVGHPDVGSKKFSTGFKALGSRLFRTYEWRQLPESHAVFSSTYPASKWKVKPIVAGLGNGSREFFILLPDGDPAKFWNVRNWKTKPEQSELMANILAYAVNRNDMLARGKSFMVQPDNGKRILRSVKVARLQYSGNWNPEPYGWKRFAAVMLNRDGVGVDVVPIKLGDGKLNPGEFKVAHITGTTDFVFKANERDEIKKFVEGGGTLIVDAAGGSGLFSASMKKELNLIFPGAGPAIDLPMKLDHPLFAAGGGNKLEDFGYRSWARKKLGDLTKSRLTSVPIKDGGSDRAGVIISSEDLSTGLTGRPVDGVIGYSPETSTEIMRRVVLYAMK